MRRAPSPFLLAAALYVGLTVALTWPLVLHPASLVPSDLGDPMLNTWLLAWNAQTVPLTERWWNLPQFYPIPGVLSFSEHLLGLSLIATPVIAASDNAVLGYNTVFFLSFPLCAIAAWFLVWTITRRQDAALIAGIAYGFAPYRMDQFAHVQVLSAYWMPIALAGLHLYFREPRVRWLALFAAAWVLQALACGYYLIFLSVLVALWLLWFVVGRERWIDVLRVAAVSVIAALVLAPVLYGYWKWHQVYGLRRWPEEIAAFSADVLSILKAPANLLLWGWVDVVERPESTFFMGVTLVVLLVTGAVLAWKHAARRQPERLRLARLLVAGAVLFGIVAATPILFGPWRIAIGSVKLLSVGTPHKPLSVAILLLVIAGGLHPSIRAAWRARSPLAFYLLAAAAMWLFSLGPAPTFLDQPVLYKAPYAWLLMLPGVDGIRVPARFWMLALLCLSVAAGLALIQITSRWPRTRNWLPAVLCAGLLIEAWPQPMLMVAAPELRPSRTRSVTRLELPVNPQHDPIVLYRASQHRKPVFNGYSGYFAPHYWALQELLEDHDIEVLTRLSAWGAIEVVVDHELDPGGRWRQFVSSHPQSTEVYTDDRSTTYRIERGPRATLLPPVTGTPLPIASASSMDNAHLIGAINDGDIISRWHAGRAQASNDTLTVDVGALQQISGVEMLLGGYFADFPRRLRIETSTDGQTWTEAWTGGTALMALGAAIEKPLDVRLPFQFTPRAARYVRFVLLAGEDVYYWSVAELRIFGA